MENVFSFRFMPPETWNFIFSNDFYDKLHNVVIKEVKNTIYAYFSWYILHKSLFNVLSHIYLHIFHASNSFNAPFARYKLRQITSSIIIFFLRGGQHNTKIFFLLSSTWSCKSTSPKTWDFLNWRDFLFRSHQNHLTF